MKKITFSILALFALLFASCMDGNWEAPALTQVPYGNDTLQETNVVSIQALKEKYDYAINTSLDTYVKIEEDIQIKGVVTGNDLTGNLYNQIVIQDETAAIVLAINEGGLYGYLPEGREILVSLKGLMIGGYRKLGEIGGVYTNNNTGAQSIGKMNRQVWAACFKILDGGLKPVEPQVFDKAKVKDAAYRDANCSKLMTIKGVEFKKGDGLTVFAPNPDGKTSAVNQGFKGIADANLVVRTSTYADFANTPLPIGKVDVTGIFSRYNNTWQIAIRSLNDVRPAE